MELEVTRRGHEWTILFRASVSRATAEEFITSGRAGLRGGLASKVEIVGLICY